MIALSMSDAAKTRFVSLGLPLDDMPMWWGALPALQRADDVFSLFTHERRQALNTMSAKAPSDLLPRDKAFYAGLLIETAMVIGAEASS